jgi:predicted glycosyltransferase
VKVWIDLSNSPHALLFAPIARRLEELGHTVFVTARDNAQTVELGRGYWPGLEVVGDESPAGRVAKAQALAARVGALRRIARRERPDVALSHNSYAQIVAAKLAGVRAVTAMDFEFQPANHLAFRLADRVLLPEALRGTVVRRQGARDGKTRYYPGLKEELYLGDFRPVEGIRDRLGPERANERLLVVMRTPPSRALYHRFGSPLFEEIMRRLGADPDVLCVVLTRHPEQREALAELDLPSVVAPAQAVDSRALMYAADLVVGAGGTMTREAALLGVPTVSVFAGEVPALDRQLVERGLLRRVTAAEDILPLARRTQPPRPIADLEQRRDELVAWFVDAAGLAR